MSVTDLILRIAADIEDLNRAQKKIASIGQDLSRLGRDMTTYVTLPLAAAGTFAIKAAIDLETAFTGVIKTVDATEAELAKLNQGFKDMATEIPLSIEQLYGIGEAAGQLGIEVPNIIGFTDVMAKLGATTNLSGQEAATALARLANITQMPQKSFDRLGSTIVALGNNLATTEAEIVEMGLRLAGAGKQVGMTEAQILGLAGALSSVGVEAQMGGSAFSRVMVDMQLAVETGGAALENFAAVAGMSVSEFQKAFQEDAATAIVAFVEGLGKAEERGMSAIKVLDDMGITEIRLRDALLRAAGAGDLFRESIELGSAAWAENTALTREAELRFGTAASQLQILANETKLTAAAFGEELAPILLELINEIKPYLEAFREMDSEQKKAIITLAALAAAIGPVLWVTGLMITGVSRLVSLFHGVAYAAKGLRLAFGAVKLVVGAAAGTLLLIAAVTAAVVAGVTWLTEKLWAWEGAANRVKIALTSMLSVVGGPIAMIINIAKNFGAYKEQIVNDVQAVIDFFANLPETVLNILNAVGGWFSELPGRIGEGLAAAGAFLLKFFTEDLPYWTGIGIGTVIRFFLDLPGNIWEGLNLVAAKLAEWGPIAWEWAKDTGLKLVTGFIDWVKELPGRTWTWLVETAKKIPLWASQLWTFAVGAADKLVTGAMSVIKNLPGLIWNTLMDAAKKLLTIGGTLWDYAKKAGEKLWEGFKKGIGKSSPSYIEQAMFDIQKAAHQTVGMLHHDFGSLSRLQMPVTLMGLAATGGGADNRDYSRNYEPRIVQHFYGDTSPKDMRREVERISQRLAIEGGIL